MGFPGWGGLLNLNQKSGVLSKEPIRHIDTGRQWRLFITRAVGGVILGTYICS